MSKEAVDLAEMLDAIPLDPDSPHSPTIQRALNLARQLQTRASELQTPEERKQQTELDRMIHQPGDKNTLMQLTDQAFRSETPHRAADQLIHILDVQGIPRFFSPIEWTMLKGFQSFGAYLPGVAVPLVKERMQHETANVILPAEREMLVEHLSKRRAEGVRMNVNFLGEALLGEEDARARLQQYLQALQVPEIEVMSVKISTIYSQISTLSRESTIDVLCERLELLYRAAQKNTFVRSDGETTSKFVYLDMEEYRDMRITVDAFMRTLDRPGLESVRAGIVLQAYVPDSFQEQQRLTTWARQRVAQGGEPITIRVVKGANMEMERFEASLHGWPQAPFQSKRETDANYKRMLLEGMQPDNITAVRLGIASHNLFDVAYGLVLAIENQALQMVQFEMLEGMANHQRRALFELMENMLLYAPACKKEDFIHAIGYLVRRLDENTGPENFLRHTFRLEVDSDDWRELEEGFLSAFELLDQQPEARRTQDRNLESDAAPIPPEGAYLGFVNEPDTDFTLESNQQWARDILNRWRDRCGDQAIDVPLVVGGEEIWDDRERKETCDPSRPQVVVARYRAGTEDDVQRAIACAAADESGWRTRSPEERAEIMAGVARGLRRKRGDLLGAALADGGKLLTESDPEVSEAIDFVEFYTRCATHFFRDYPELTASPVGVVAVVSPWNFPIAIPCGGISAALAAGNCVILKPASDAVLPAWELCQCFWDAGVPKEALQLLPCSGGGPGAKLVSDPRVDVVILTGGTETALRMLESRPDMRLLAETGGKNATIVTAMSDRDQAIKNVIHSAFGHGGQKCSATSLLILEAEVYEDESFRNTLCDAVKSMKVGSAWELDTKIGPLIRPPTSELERGLKELEQGESWAVMPRMVDGNPYLYSPGIKWNVQPGAFTHCTEFFGPVLAVMKARNLLEAISLVNQTGYGLTSGLESLDDREQEQWRELVRAGNLYINRGTTGAIVLRQPFGGFGKSAFGPGIKAGGPNYVAQLMHFQDHEPSPPSLELADDHPLAGLENDLILLLREGFDGAEESEIQRAIDTLLCYAKRYREEFGVQHDHVLVVGQDNIRRYLPARELRVRVHEEDSWFEVVARIAAARVCECRTTVSSPPGLEHPAVELMASLSEPWAGAIEFIEETDAELAVAVQNERTDRVRFAAEDRVPVVVRQAAAVSSVYLADAPVLQEGRIELLWYLREQSVSDNYHRYGNLGVRGDEQRGKVL